MLGSVNDYILFVKRELKPDFKAGFYVCHAEKQA
jgi:hypothetical protein